MEGPQKKLDISPIIGGVLGGITVLILIGICIIRRRRKWLKANVDLMAHPLSEHPEDVIPGIPAPRMIPSQKSRRHITVLGIPRSMSRTEGLQMAEALEEEFSHQQMQSVSKQHGDDVECVLRHSASAKYGLGDDITETQEDMNLIAFQHHDSGLRVVEFPPTYSSLL